MQSPQDLLQSTALENALATLTNLESWMLEKVVLHKTPYIVEGIATFNTGILMSDQLNVDVLYSTAADLSRTDFPTDIFPAARKPRAPR